jgi:hypothetical protein
MHDTDCYLHCPACKTRLFEVRRVPTGKEGCFANEPVQIGQCDCGAKMKVLLRCEPDGNPKHL